MRRFQQRRKKFGNYFLIFAIFLLLDAFDLRKPRRDTFLGRFLRLVRIIKNSRGDKLQQFNEMPYFLSR